MDKLIKTVFEDQPVATMSLLNILKVNFMKIYLNEMGKKLIILIFYSIAPLPCFQCHILPNTFWI